MSWYKWAQSQQDDKPEDPMALTKIKMNFDRHLPLSKTSKKTVVSLDAKKLIKRLAEDQPWQDISLMENRIDDRVGDAKRFIQRNINNPQHPKWEPSKAVFNDDGKLMFIDGRHRIAAAIELGYTYVPVAIHVDQKEKFIRELG